MSILKIAVVNPERADAMARTIIDGLLSLSQDGEIDFRLSSDFKYNLPLKDKVLSRQDFIGFALEADWIFLMGNDKYGYDSKLMSIIDCWEKTIYVDGSEMGKNERYNFKAQKDIINGTYAGEGNVDRELMKKCCCYCRREKPYLGGIHPMPFGIETQYVKEYKEEIEKDIDFFCVFGQDQYPLMRRYARELVEKFCRDNGFSCVTEKTKTPQEFYKLLARSKVGISVGGGGYDTMRFWEILGNNCLLLTETLDIYEPDSKRLDYKRISQFNNLFDLDYRLREVGGFLREGYKMENLKREYEEILKEHSSSARVREILNLCGKK